MVAHTADALVQPHRASYCEIYNEALYDLLRFSKQQLSVRWDAQRGFHAPDLAVKDCGNVEDLLQVRVMCHSSPAAQPGSTARMTLGAASERLVGP